LHEPPVQTHFALRIAATPAALRARQHDARQRFVEQRAKVRHPRAKMHRRVTPVPAEHELAHVLGQIRLVQRELEDTAVAQLRDWSALMRTELDAQGPSEEVDLLAVAPYSITRSACGVDRELAQHPIGRLLQQRRNAVLGGAPWCADRQPSFIDSEQNAAPLGAALEGVGDVLFAQPNATLLDDAFGILEELQLDLGGVHESPRNRGSPIRSTSSSIHCWTRAFNSSALRPRGSIAGPMLTVMVPGRLTKASRRHR